MAAAFFVGGLKNEMIAAAPREKRKPLPDDDFVELDDVPVFSEHTNREGVKIDEEALESTCERCNERITETGDYCPIVLRHTTDDGSFVPEVIGYAGPYRMGRLGSKKPKAAILAKFRIYREDYEKLKKHPRRSVEFWASEEDPTCGYFDPISLLGAETPELDLGIRYAKGRRGHRVMRYQKVERYEAAFPGGGSNTFVPSTGSTAKPKVTRLDGKPLDTDDKYETSIKYGAGGMALTSDDLQQLVIALTPVIQTTVNEAVRAATAPGPEIDEDVDAIGGDAGLDATGGDAPIPGTDLDAPGGDAGLDAPGGDVELGGGDMDADDDGDSDDDGIPDDLDDDDDDDDGIPDESDATPEPPKKKKKAPAKFAKHCLSDGPPDHYAKMCGYSDEVEADKYFADLDDDGKQSVRASIDGDDNLDRKTKMRKKYMATATTTDVPTAVQYRKVQKENTEIRTRYAKLNREHSELQVKHAKQEEELSGVRSEKKRAVRYQKLSELASSGYCLEPHDEMEETDHLTDDQFESHCTRIVTKYQRVPLGLLPVAKPLTYDGSTREAKSQKYAKQARDEVLAARSRGEVAEYATVLNRLIDADSVVGATK